VNSRKRRGSGKMKTHGEKRFRKGAELRGPEECAELAQGAEG
jgi:hypothetical protein